MFNIRNQMTRELPVFILLYIMVDELKILEPTQACLQACSRIWGVPDMGMKCAAIRKRVNCRKRRFHTIMFVRRAGVQDIKAILDLLVQVDMVHHAGRPDLFKGPATKYSAEELAKIISDDRTPVFVCVENDDSTSGKAETEKVLGHAFCILEEYNGDRLMTDRRTLYIDDICVDEDERGRHVGQTLYRYVEDYAVSIGCYNVTLNVWECNPGARRFYEAMGMGIQKTGMEKVL